MYNYMRDIINYSYAKKCMSMIHTDSNMNHIYKGMELTNLGVLHFPIRIETIPLNADVGTVLSTKLTVLDSLMSEMALFDLVRIDYDVVGDGMFLIKVIPTFLDGVLWRTLLNFGVVTGIIWAIAHFDLVQTITRWISTQLK